MSIAKTAQIVAGCVPGPIDVRITGKPVPGGPIEQYVPSTAQAEIELGLKITISDGITRTLSYEIR